jgi:hypothetical protein
MPGTEKNTPTFYQHGKRRVKCSNKKCSSYIAKKSWALYTRLSDNKIRPTKCPHCGHEALLSPPKKININGEKKIQHGLQSTLTTDYTDSNLTDAHK